RGIRRMTRTASWTRTEAPLTAPQVMRNDPVGAALDRQRQWQEAAAVLAPHARSSMKSIADQLPPEIARQIHPDRRKNEAEYWAVRDQLLDQYRGQWIGFADGKVIASGSSPVTVFHAAEASGQHPFFICVGREEEPCRIRRVTFPYDASYPGEALPLISVEFRQASGMPGDVLDRVIPDTGADASVLPWADCQLLQLAPAMGVQGLI